MAIAHMLGVRRPTVIGWLSAATYEEGRGWKPGVRRRYTDKEARRVVAIKRAMIERDDYLLGPEQIQMHYEAAYPLDPIPSVWFMQEMTRQHGLQTHEPRQRSTGRDLVARLLFPIRSLVSLGRIQQAADFIGKKFIAGRREPISIFSTGYYQWLKLHQIAQVTAETAASAMTALHRCWTRFPVPNVLRMDNGMTFRGTGRTDGHIGRFLKFLLNVGVTPLFSAPYRSYTNPHIEGHNSAFARKLWAKHSFISRDEIDRECDRFNAENERFYRWKFKERLAQKSLRYLSADRRVADDLLRSTKGKKICFIRFVECWSERADEHGVVILDRFVPIPETYGNQYVFAELHLATATLHIYSEREGAADEIAMYPFPFTL